MAAILAKFGMNRRNTLHKPRKDLNSARDVGNWSFSMASIKCDAAPKRHGRMRYLKQLMVSAKK